MPPHRPACGEAHGEAEGHGRGRADNVTEADGDQIIGKPAIFGCTSATLDAASKNKDADKAERLECQWPTRTALPLGNGDTAIGSTLTGMKAIDPSLTAIGSVCTTVEQDRFIAVTPLLAVKTT